MNLFWLAVLWLPISLLIHNVVHEVAHIVVALMHGLRVKTLWPLPGWHDGRFHWAYAEVEGALSPKGLSWFAIAPVIAEIVWLICASIGFALSYDELRTIMFIEMLIANADIINWIRPWWMAIPDPQSDAELYRASVTMGLGGARMLSTVYSYVGLWTLVCWWLL